MADLNGRRALPLDFSARQLGPDQLVADRLDISPGTGSLGPVVVTDKSEVVAQLERDVPHNIVLLKHLNASPIIHEPPCAYLTMEWLRWSWVMRV